MARRVPHRRCFHTPSLFDPVAYGGSVVIARAQIVLWNWSAFIALTRLNHDYNATFFFW